MKINKRMFGIQGHCRGQLSRHTFARICIQSRSLDSIHTHTHGSVDEKRLPAYKYINTPNLSAQKTQLQLTALTNDECGRMHCENCRLKTDSKTTSRRPNFAQAAISQIFGNLFAKICGHNKCNNRNRTWAIKSATTPNNSQYERKCTATTTICEFSRWFWQMDSGISPVSTNFEYL